MPPKKREKEGETSKNQRTEQVKTDHDLFLQAFEKPTQIYRYLRVRNAASPIFLQRNLSYMRYRMSRSHKSRQNFKVDSLLEKVSKSHMPENLRQGFMTLTFLGYYDKKNEAIKEEAAREPVKVETLLLKICHKKRKDTTTPVMTVSVGTCYVPINPSEEFPPPKAPTVSISTNEFTEELSEVKSYHLLLRVYNAASNGLTGPNNTDQEIGEPLQKRRKTSVGREEMKCFGTDLVIYDKQKRCLLGDGDYELLLDEVPNARNMPKKFPSWEPIGDMSEDCSSFELFSNGPTLKFKLEWTRELRSSFVDRPRSVPINEEEILDSNSNKENRPERAAKKQSTEKEDKKHSALAAKKPVIVYQFHYNNNSRQQTEPCRDLHCPWCSLDCGSLFSLLKHLKLCHARFTFTYAPLQNMARIDVAINESYDGSYTGSPHDVIAQPGGSAFSRNGPQIRTTVSNILVCHPKRHKPSLSEFMELEEESGDLQRSFITGHNRLYHHTVTCLPVHPKEMDNDSEGENDPKWLQTKTMMMIDEFTDVNEGEKELMKMWNLHVMREGYVGDCQIPIACKMFVEKKGKELLEKNLYRNFIVHVCSLFDYGLVSPVVIYQTIQLLHSMIEEKHAKLIQGAWEAQKQFWIKTGAKERQQTPSHFKNQAPAGISSDPNARRKLYSPGSYQNDSPSRRKAVQQDEEEEDEEDDDKEEQVKSCSSTTSSSSESSAPKKKNSTSNNEVNKRKPASEKSGQTATQLLKNQAMPGKSQTSSVQRLSNGPQSSKALPAAAPSDTGKRKASSLNSTPNASSLKPVPDLASIAVANKSPVSNEPPTKKKLIVTQANGKPQAVTTQSLPSSDLKRKISVGSVGPSVSITNSNDSKNIQSHSVNGSQQMAGKNTSSQIDSKKRASLPSSTSGQTKSISSNVTSSSLNFSSDSKKKASVNGLNVLTDKLFSTCTVEVQQMKESGQLPTSGKMASVTSSDAKRKPSLGPPNSQQDGQQRRKSVSADSPNITVPTVPEAGAPNAALRRKSFSSSQSMDSSPNPNPVPALASKGVAT